MRCLANPLTRALSLLSFVAAVFSPVEAQTPVLNPTNGHYYAKVSSSGISWTAAKAAAASMSHQGVTGHLATCTDSGENQWVYSALGSNLDYYWLGGYQDHNSPSYAEPGGGWRWITPEPWVFNAWSITYNEPNNSGGSEDYLEFNHALAVWNDAPNNWPSRGFIVEFDLGVTVYCTAGTTSSGCVPSISATGVASASSSSGFTISAVFVEGLKQGILFYGIDNTGFSPAPWTATSTSYLCVKHPTQRTGAQNSGGSFGQCDGVLDLDWNAYNAAHPGALGAPFSAGQHVFAQGWFRDPLSPKTTMLTDAIEFILAP